jgi:hypothetical protein
MLGISEMSYRSVGKLGLRCINSVKKKICMIEKICNKKYGSLTNMIFC